MSNLLFHNFDKPGATDVDQEVEDFNSTASNIISNHGSSDGNDTNDDADTINQYDEQEMIKYLQDDQQLGEVLSEDEQHIEHSCAYCGIHNPCSVIKCNTCNKWFCNAKTSSSSSHIVTF